MGSLLVTFIRSSKPYGKHNTSTDPCRPCLLVGHTAVIREVALTAPGCSVALSLVLHDTWGAEREAELADVPASGKPLNSLAAAWCVCAYRSRSKCKRQPPPAGVDRLCHDAEYRTHSRWRTLAQLRRVQQPVGAYVENRVAQALEASIGARSCPKLQAAPSFGQARLISRVVRAGRPYRPCFQHRCVPTPTSTKSPKGAAFLTIACSKTSPVL